MNIKTHRFYNSKFVMRVLNLTQIESVSEEEKQSDLYYWAQLFRATSWEEISMLAEKKSVLNEAVTTIQKLNADERIRMQCEAQEKYEHDMASAYGAGIEQGIQAMILDNIEENIPLERICEKLQRRFEIREQEALKHIANATK